MYTKYIIYVYVCEYCNVQCLHTHNSYVIFACRHCRVALYALYYICMCGYNYRVLPGLSVSLFTALTKSAAIRENSSSTETNKQAVMVAIATNKCHYDKSVHSLAVTTSHTCLRASHTHVDCHYKL